MAVDVSETVFGKKRRLVESWRVFLHTVIRRVDKHLSESVFFHQVSSHQIGSPDVNRYLVGNKESSMR